MKKKDITICCWKGSYEGEESLLLVLWSCPYVFMVFAVMFSVLITEFSTRTKCVLIKFVSVLTLEVLQLLKTKELFCRKEYVILWITVSKTRLNQVTLAVKS